MIADQIAGRIRAGDFRAAVACRRNANWRNSWVSRASIREALIALEIEGYVEVRVGSGVFVTAREGAAPPRPPPAPRTSAPSTCWKRAC